MAIRMAADTSTRCCAEHFERASRGTAHREPPQSGRADRGEGAGSLVREPALKRASPAEYNACAPALVNSRRSETYSRDNAPRRLPRAPRSGRVAHACATPPTPKRQDTDMVVWQKSQTQHQPARVRPWPRSQSVDAFGRFPAGRRIPCTQKKYAIQTIAKMKKSGQAPCRSARPIRTGMRRRRSGATG